MSSRNQKLQPNAQPNNGSGNPGGSNGQSNMGGLGQIFNNMDFNQILGQVSQMMGGSQPGAGAFPGGPGQAPRPAPPRDSRVQLLQAMKPFLNKKRSTMLDGIGQLYAIVRIIRGRR